MFSIGGISTKLLLISKSAVLNISTKLLLISNSAVLTSFWLFFFIVGFCCRYCTGGIRCEMASAYIRSKGVGFENVFQVLSCNKWILIFYVANFGCIG